jgi:hypothetical protein
MMMTTATNGRPDIDTLKDAARGARDWEYRQRTEWRQRSIGRA